MKIYKYEYQKECKQNPYIGFTSFQHFNDEELYSDLIVKPENNFTETEHVECYPIPDYVEQKGRAQGYYPDCSVVYIRILWKEFEPIEGQFNYAFIEDILEKAKKSGQTVMFRLMQHSTRETDDVPDWLKEKIDCPKRPIGMRVKDCPSDPKFLDYFARAVRAFGQRFDSNPTLAFMDVSYPGSWGEGSHVKLFTKEQIFNYIDVFTDVFKNTLLIGQVNTPWTVEYFNEKYDVGWRADCVGQPSLTYETLPPNVARMGDIWKRGHISFESFWWLGEWQRKGWDLDKVIETLLSWHISTFNAKSLPIPFEWKDKIDAWVAKMGYHFVIDQAEIPEKANLNEQFAVNITIDNVGVAPIYHKIPLYVRFKNKDFSIDVKSDVDIREWIEGKYTEQVNVKLPNNMPLGEYEVQFGIGGGEFPSVVFATNAKQDKDFSIVGKINII